MEEYKQALRVLQRLRPVMFDVRWRRALKLIPQIANDKTSGNEQKKRQFVAIVDELCKEQV